MKSLSEGSCPFKALRGRTSAKGLSFLEGVSLRTSLSCEGTFPSGTRPRGEPCLHGSRSRSRRYCPRWRGFHSSSLALWHPSQEGACPRLAGEDGGRGMPVVWRADDDGIHVLAVEDFPEGVECPRADVRSRLLGTEPTRPRIAPVAGPNRFLRGLPDGTFADHCDYRSTTSPSCRRRGRRNARRERLLRSSVTVSAVCPKTEEPSASSSTSCGSF